MAYTRKEWRERLASRSDLTASVSHFTRSQEIGDERISARRVLLKILKDKKLKGSTSSGYICGSTPAVCFQDAPLYALAQNIYREQRIREEKSATRYRYTGYGLMFDKTFIYKSGGRHVFYEQTRAAKEILPETEWWRIVKHDLTDKQGIVDWTHEREWRLPGNLKFTWDEVIVLLPTIKSYRLFLDEAEEELPDMLTEIRGIVSLASIFY